MATRLAQQSPLRTTSRTRAELEQSPWTEPLIRESDLRVVVQPLQAGLGKRVRVYGAVATWMAGIFALIYVAGPLAMAMVGWTAALGSVLHNAVAFAITVPAILLMLEWRRPEMHLHRSLDPVLPVALGSLTSWALLHNTVGILRPFAAFGAGELLAFVALNAVEFVLFGMVFSTLVRSRSDGFLLGFLFQFGYVMAFVLGSALIL